MRGATGSGGRIEAVRFCVSDVHGPDLRAERVASLAGATLGVMTAASLALVMIGHALAQARGLVSKHAAKQADRLPSNDGINVRDGFACWAPRQVAGRQAILVAMDWTGFDHDDQATLALSLVTGHGCAAPLLWLGVWKELKNRRNDDEGVCLRRLGDLIPPGRRVTILAGRGFGDHKLFACLGELGFDCVIRFRGAIHVMDADGQTRQAGAWAGQAGRARKLRDARVTAKGQQVDAVVCVHAKDMKEPGRLAMRQREATAATLIDYHAQRWASEPQFRDAKDLPFGTGLSSIRSGEPMRRDRLLLISAFATAMPTLLGAVGESLGRDRPLKSSTSKTRTHPLFRQGCILHDLIPNMPQHRLLLLMRHVQRNAFNHSARNTICHGGMRGSGRLLTG